MEQAFWKDPADSQNPPQIVIRRSNRHPAAQGSEDRKPWAAPVGRRRVCPCQRVRYWMIYRGPGFLAVVWFYSYPIPSFPSPVSKFDRRQIGRPRKRDNFLADRGQTIRRQESLVLYKIQCCGSVKFWYGPGIRTTDLRILDPGGPKHTDPNPQHCYKSFNTLWSLVLSASE